ncbi:MAG: FtsQ-type POTRA domain-containing protein [Clostridia bacterium]|nr:FtsQ-type POTRA domain-containing protein [Clostridia bacterium]
MKKRYISIAVGLVLVMLVAVLGNICKITKIEVCFEKAAVKVSSVEIFENSGIEMGESILSLNENLVRRNVMQSYSDNSIIVTNIERVFPNKVVIYVTENVPICAISVAGQENHYALADGNFQLTRIVGIEDVVFDELIYIDGVQVGDTFNTPTFETIHKLFRAFEQEGLDYNAQARFFEKITYSASGTINILTRDGITLQCDYSSDDLQASVKGAYLAYLSQKNS